MNIQQFDFAADLLGSVLWQYDQATKLVGSNTEAGLLTQKQTWFNENYSEFWFVQSPPNAGWFNTVFNIETADKFGLAIWAMIMNVPLFVGNPAESNTQVWGYNVKPFPGSNNKNFGVLGSTRGNFSNKDTNIYLSEQEQRFLLRLRYYQLTTAGNITSSNNIAGINGFLNFLTETSVLMKTATEQWLGDIYVIDNLDMTITYVFTESDFPLPLQKAMVLLDLFRRPAGVDYTIEVITPTNTPFQLLNSNLFGLLNGNNFVLLE